MASYEDLMQAARRADSAGDPVAARRFLELAGQQRQSMPEGQKPDLTKPLEPGDTDSPIPTPLLQKGREIVRQAEDGEPIHSGGDEMRARGLSSPSPSTANAQAAADMQRAQDERFVEENPIGSRAEAFTAGLPFVGEWTDEALGAVAGDKYRDQLRTDREAFTRARPVEDAALRTAGGVAGAIPLAVVGGPLAAAAGPRSVAMQALAGAGAGAAAGGLEGAVSGAGAADDGDRAKGAERGAMAGGAVGAGLGLISPVASAGLRHVVNFVKGSDVATIASELGISTQAAKAVRAALEGEDLGRATQQIARGGPDAMLVEAGPATQALGKGVAASGGEATTIMRNAIADRADGAAAQMKGALDASMGKPSGRIDLAAGIRAATKKARGEAYDRAYTAPIDYASPQGRRIEDILTRMPAKTGKAAIAKANDRMAYDGVENKQIMAEIGDDGRVRFSEMPNPQQLDYIKRAFDEIAEDGKDAVTGKLSSDAAFASRVARDLRNAHGAANPAYREALRTGMDSIQSERAVETGYKALQPSTTPEELRKSLSGLNGDARNAAKLGARQAIDDATANVRAIMSRPGMDAEVGEAMKAIKDLSSRASQRKLEMLVGVKEARTLIGKADELKTAFEIQAALSRNSDTAVNQAVQASIDKSAAPGPVGRLLAGEPVQAAKRLTQIITGSTPEAQEAVRGGIYTEIARALTEKRGDRAKLALMGITRAMHGQSLTDEQAQRIAHNAVAALGLTGYSAGKEALTAN